MRCPWCHEEIQLRADGSCPSCLNAVPLYESADGAERDLSASAESLEDLIAEKFRCLRCRGGTCEVRETAVTGAAISKLPDIPHRRYLIVSCLSCGSVEIYDRAVLEGTARGRAGIILDILFGG